MKNAGMSGMGAAPSAMENHALSGMKHHALSGMKKADVPYTKNHDLSDIKNPDVNLKHPDLSDFKNPDVDMKNPDLSDIKRPDVPDMKNPDLSAQALGRSLCCTFSVENVKKRQKIDDQTIPGWSAKKSGSEPQTEHHSSHSLKSRFSAQRAVRPIDAPHSTVTVSPETICSPLLNFQSICLLSRGSQGLMDFIIRVVKP